MLKKFIHISIAANKNWNKTNIHTDGQEHLSWLSQQFQTPTILSICIRKKLFNGASG